MSKSNSVRKSDIPVESIYRPILPQPQSKHKDNPLVTAFYVALLIKPRHFPQKKQTDLLVLGSVDIALLPDALHHLTGLPPWNLAPMVTCCIHSERIRR